MSLWRYTAIPADGGRPTTGELAGEGPAEVRAALRRLGLRPLEVRPLHRGARRRGEGQTAGAAAFTSLAERLDAHRRSRRAGVKAELLDSLATMIGSGVPVAEALGVVAGDARAGHRARRELLLRLREAVRGGRMLGEALGDEAGWFDGAEAAAVRAGERSGDLAGALSRLAERRSRSGELAGRLAAALTYPVVVLLVGLGVTVFLATRTLPQLAGVLTDARVPVPALTKGVIAAGEGIVRFGPFAAAALLGLPLAWLALADVLRRHGLRADLPETLVPAVARRAAVAEAILALAELARSGVPAVEALRVVAPTVRGPGAARLRDRLTEAAASVERGGTLGGALADRRWFGDELRRLVEVGEASGELPAVLERVGERERRAARRLVDRLAGLLEPASILFLAVLVLLVVMGAVQPLLRLQEVVR